MTKIRITSAFGGESTNCTSTGSAPAMYVPTTGRNWLMRPTHSAIATGAWVPIAWNTTQWKNADNPASRARE